MASGGWRRRSPHRTTGRAGGIAELRSKIRDSRYLERAIRCLAQIFIDDATRGPHA